MPILTGLGVASAINSAVATVAPEVLLVVAGGAGVIFATLLALRIGTRVVKNFTR